MKNFDHIDPNRRTRRHVFELQYNYCPQSASAMMLSTIDHKRALKCTRCEFVFWNNPNPVVSALIIYKEKVLLIKRTGITGRSQEEL